MMRSFPIIISSDPANGALNLSDDGSTFNIILYSPIAFPMNTTYISCEVQGANIWNTSPNISIALDNNTFQFNDGVSTYNLAIPKGLYDLGGLQSALYTEINNLPAAQPAKDLFFFTANNATQKVVVNFVAAGVNIFWANSTVRKILGFDTTSPTTAPAGQSITAPNVAAFNQTTSFFIKADIVRNGIPVNQNASGIAANVFIDVLPGSLINYQPQSPVQMDCSHLIGAAISQINCQLTNQNNVVSDTNGEFYSFTLIFRYM